MPGKPYRSKLLPYLDTIRDLRNTEPPTPYSIISKILEDKYGVKSAPSSIFSFVKVRSKSKCVYRIQNTHKRIEPAICYKKNDPKEIPPMKQLPLLVPYIRKNASRLYPYLDMIHDLRQPKPNLTPWRTISLILAQRTTCRTSPSTIYEFYHRRLRKGDERLSSRKPKRVLQTDVTY